MDARVDGADVAATVDVECSLVAVDMANVLDMVGSLSDECAVKTLDAA